MKLGALFTGGKDSTYAVYLAKQEGHEIVCLISIYSRNKESYMFHTPSITTVEVQAESMGLPIMINETEGSKELELEDLEAVIVQAKEKYHIEGVLTGAIASVYQASRIKSICDKHGLALLNPLWGKDQIELLNELIDAEFKVIITGVFAYPFDESWLGREMTDEQFIEEVKILQEKYRINPAGEGGEFESLVLNCPLFSRELKIIEKSISGEGNSFSMEVVLE